MKTPPSLLIMAGLALSFASCDKSGSKNAYQPATPAAIGEKPVTVDWKLVGDEPPLYLPKGLPTGASTDADHGEWIQRNGAQYYVPFRGAGRAQYAHLVAALPADNGATQTRGPVGEFANKVSPANLIPVRGEEKKQKAEKRVDAIWATES